jgi:non-heme chloroperoxidase
VPRFNFPAQAQKFNALAAGRSTKLIVRKGGENDGPTNRGEIGGDDWCCCGHDGRWRGSGWRESGEVCGIARYIAETLSCRDQRRDQSVLQRLGHGQAGGLQPRLGAQCGHLGIPVTELTDQGLRCIAYDRRGHGRSSDPGRGYDYDTLSDDLAAIIERLDLTEVTLVGFSMGSGEVARYLSHHGSSRIARTVLVGAVAPNTDGGLFPSFIAGLKQDRPAFLAGGVPMFVGTESAVSPAMSQWVLAQFLRASPKAMIECMRAVSASDLRADFAAIKLPTLIIHGADDQVSPFDKTGKLTAAAIPGCQLRIYENAPHGLVITHRDRFTKDLLAFIAST